jgi:hypothetical protein
VVLSLRAIPSRDCSTRCRALYSPLLVGLACFTWLGAVFFYCSRPLMSFAALGFRTPRAL